MASCRNFSRSLMIYSKPLLPYLVVKNIITSLPHRCVLKVQLISPNYTDDGPYISKQLARSNTFASKHMLKHWFSSQI